MAKATPSTHSPSSSCLSSSFPKFPLDALFGLQNANLAAAHEVQTIVLEAIQGIAKVQHGWIQRASRPSRRR